MTTSNIAKSAKINDNCTIEDPIDVGPGVICMAEYIGRYTFINWNTCIFNQVKIGRFVSFGRNCQIGGAEHPVHHVTTSFFRMSRNWFPNDPLAQTSKLITKSPPPHRKRGNDIVIGNDVWIGQNAIVLKGVTIGNGAVVGAGSVVTKDVEPYTIVAGNPAKTVRKRFDEKTIDRLLKSQWWDLDPNVIATLPLGDVEQTLSQIEHSSAHS